MDVTPQLLKDVEFREKFRGYDPDEVDDFLERVGAAFAQMQDKLRDANDQIESANARAARAEARARDSSDIDDTLRRTLVLAQRTADAAIKEAEEQAAAIVAEAQATSRQQLSASEERASQTLASAESEARRKQDAAEAHTNMVLSNADTQAEQTMSSAREQANRLLTDARNQAEHIVSEARLSADRVAGERREALAAEVSSLEARREALSHNVELLDTHLGSQRARLEAVLVDMRTLLDDPERLVTPSSPELREEPAVIKAPPLPESPTETEADVAESHGEAANGAVEAVYESRPEAHVDQHPAELTADADTEVGQTLPSSDTGVDEAPPATLAYESEDVYARPPLLMAAQDDSSATNASGTAVLEPPAAEADDLERTQQYDFSAHELESEVPPAPPAPPMARPASPTSASSSGVVPASTWPAGGPPPPPPPPRAGGRQPAHSRTEPPAPPPPPAAETSGTRDPSVPPWLTTTPAPSPPPAPAPPADSFLDELRRAVGDEPTEDAADDPAKRFFEDRDPTDPAARFLEDPDSTNRTWFGRRR